MCVFVCVFLEINITKCCTYTQTHQLLTTKSVEIEKPHKINLQNKCLNKRPHKRT